MFRKITDFEKFLSVMQGLKNRPTFFYDDFDSSSNLLSTTSSWPRVNIHEEDNAVYIYCELPGVKEDEINIKLHNNLLTIKGERKLDIEDKYSILRQERHENKFSRSFTLPMDIDNERTSASLKNGILTLKLVKTPIEKSRKIAVEIV